MKLSRRLRVWTMLNEAPLALGLAFLIVTTGAVLVVAGALWALESRGAEEQVEGVVQSFGMRESDQGSYRVIVVRTADGLVSMRAPVRKTCRVGDHAVLDRKPIRLGSLYALKSCRPA